MTLVIGELVRTVFGTPVGLVLLALITVGGYALVLRHPIDRYLLREMGVPAGVGAALALVLLLGNVLYAVLQEIYSLNATADEVVKLLVYQVPFLTLQAIPAALLIGTALSLTRLERERELLAMRLTGTRVIRLLIPTLLTGLVGAGALYVLQECVMPGTTRQADKLVYQMQWRQPVNSVPSDVVFREGDKYIYIREVDKVHEKLLDVLIYEQTLDGGMRFFSIPTAQNQNGVWVARGDPRTGKGPVATTFDPAMRMTAVADNIDGMVLDLHQQLWEYLADPPLKAEELTLPQLWELRTMERGTGLGLGAGLILDPSQLNFYLNNKFAAPLAALVGVLVAAPLAIRFGRTGGGYSGLLIAAAIAFFFIVSQQWAKVLALRPEPLMNPTLAAWGPTLLFALIGAVVLMFQE